MAATTNSTDPQNPAPQDFPLALFERFPALIWRADQYASCTYVNRTWLEFTGRALERELGDGWTAGLHPENMLIPAPRLLLHLTERLPDRPEKRDVADGRRGLGALGDLTLYLFVTFCGIKYLA